MARQAMREYAESHSRAELLDQVLDEELPHYAESFGAARSVIYPTLSELLHISEQTLGSDVPVTRPVVAGDRQRRGVGPGSHPGHVLVERGPVVRIFRSERSHPNRFGRASVDVGQARHRVDIGTRRNGRLPATAPDAGSRLPVGSRIARPGACTLLLGGRVTALDTAAGHRLPKLGQLP